MAALGLNITYAIPQAVVAVRGRDNVLPPRPFALGKWSGFFCNTFSSIWVAMYVFWFCLPTTIPTLALSMNYVSVILVGALSFIGLSWFLGKRKTFTGPNVVFEGVAQFAASSAGSSTGGLEMTISRQGDMKSR